MPPPSESPFKHDDPVARSAKWMYIAGCGALLWAAAHAWRMISLFEPDIDVALDSLTRLLVVGAMSALAWTAILSGLNASECRTQRSFDVMGNALRSQRFFWNILTVAAGAGVVWLVYSALSTRDYNDTIRRWIELHSTPQQPAAAGGNRS